MSVLLSAINATEDAFQRNHAAMAGLVEDLRARSAAAALGGAQEARARHTARGKLLPRERVERLLDPGAAFGDRRSGRQRHV
jgi:3-methylcrotonyl-CoA carboxylase beta subunit